MINSDELIDKLSDQHAINKIVTISIFKYKIILFNLKNSSIQKVPVVLNEYNSMHSSDFDDARDQIQSFLLNDYPDNAYDYNEDQKQL